MQKDKKRGWGGGPIKKARDRETPSNWLLTQDLNQDGMLALTAASPWHHGDAIESSGISPLIFLRNDLIEVFERLTSSRPLLTCLS